VSARRAFADPFWRRNLKLGSLSGRGAWTFLEVSPPRPRGLRPPACQTLWLPCCPGRPLGRAGRRGGCGGPAGFSLGNEAVCGLLHTLLPMSDPFPSPTAFILAAP
jgi:hypothetical protein